MTTFKGIDLGQLREGRQLRARDGQVRKQLGLGVRPQGYVYSSVGAGTKPYPIYRDGAGQEFVQVEPGRYLPREEFDRLQRELRTASKPDSSESSVVGAPDAGEVKREPS